MNTSSPTIRRPAAGTAVRPQHPALTLTTRTSDGTSNKSKHQRLRTCVSIVAAGACLVACGSVARSEDRAIAPRAASVSAQWPVFESPPLAEPVAAPVLMVELPPLAESVPTTAAPVVLVEAPPFAEPVVTTAAPVVLVEAPPFAEP